MPRKAEPKREIAESARRPGRAAEEMGWFLTVIFPTVCGIRPSGEREILPPEGWVFYATPTKANAEQVASVLCRAFENRIFKPRAAGEFDDEARRMCNLDIGQLGKFLSGAAKPPDDSRVHDAINYYRMAQEYEAELAREAQAYGLPRPGDVKQPPTPKDASLDGLVDALNAPVEWPPATVVDELKELGERQRPGFKEEVENEKSRRDAVPVAVQMRLNNAGDWNPSDPEELEILLEKRGYYTPGQLRMEIEYFRSHPKAVPGGDRRALCEDQHNRALRMRELDSSLPPVPGYTDNPIVDEKNLWQWCTDAHVQAKVVATPHSENDNARKSVTAKGMTWQDAQGKLLAMRDKGEPYTTVEDLAARVGCGKTTLHKAIAKSDTLKGWQARHVTKAPSPKAQSLNAVVTDNARSKVDDPADVLTDDDVETVFARLLREAKPDEQAKMNGLTPERRRALVKTVQEQNYDQLIEDRAKKGNRILDRKP